MKSLRHHLGVAIYSMVAAFSFVAVAAAGTIHVFPGETIASGLAAAAWRDTVLVHCGTYLEQGLQVPSGVSLLGESGDPDCVTLVSDGSASILIFDDQANVTVIEGLTLTLQEGATATVARGGGMYLRLSYPEVNRCVFRGLQADYGGAVYCTDSAGPSFQDCTFDDNAARAAGGAVNVVRNAEPLFLRCLFVGNRSDGWGQVLNTAGGSPVDMYECTLADNAGAMSGGAELVSWDRPWQYDVNILMEHIIMQTRRAFWSDETGQAATYCSDLYSEEGNLWTGSLAWYEGQFGNISADPLFCGAAGGELPYSLDAASPCAAGASACGQIGAFGVGCAVSDVPDDSQQTVPQMTQLRGNFPNPFNPSTTIRYDVKQSGAVDLAVFDVAGRLVKRLVSEVRGAGSHEVVWRGRDRDDRQVAAGIYFVRLKVDSLVDTSRLSLIK